MRNLFPEREAFEGNRQLLGVLSQSSEKDVICRAKNPGLRLIIDPTKEFLVRHISSSWLELDVQYRTDPAYGIVPEEWTATCNYGETSIFHCQVRELELNRPLPAQTFQLNYPIGTRVVDANRNDLIVARNGRLVRHLKSWTPRTGGSTSGVLVMVGFVAVLVFIIVFWSRGAIGQRAFTVNLRRIKEYLEGCWATRRVRFTLVEFLLAFLVLAPVLAIWNLTGVTGIAFLAVWVCIGVTTFIGARRIHYGPWRVVVSLAVCLCCALAIAVADGTLTVLALSRVMFHLTIGGLIGMTCGAMPAVRISSGAGTS